MTRKQSGDSRRSFLKKGITGLAGVAVAPSLLRRNARAQEEDKPRKRSIKTRPFGKTGIDIPVLSAGCGRINDPGLLRAARVIDALEISA